MVVVVFYYYQIILRIIRLENDVVVVGLDILDCFFMEGMEDMEGMDLDMEDMEDMDWDMVMGIFFLVVWDMVFQDMDWVMVMVLLVVVYFVEMILR